MVFEVGPFSAATEEPSTKCHDDRDDDLESAYNSKGRSAYPTAHRKKLHPLLVGPNRREKGNHIPLHTASKNNLSEFTQRIMSAKLLRVKQVQNQLSETQIQLNELINENRILRNLQKRQEGALRKYEGNHAELPQLIRSHNEEIRTLKANNKAIKAQLRDSNAKLKERENELEALRENYGKLKKLSSEKNLLEREKLQKKVEELQEVVKEQDEKIQLLSRKILLESKSYRHHLSIETNKHKETQKDLNNALAMVSRLENQLLAKEKVGWVPSGLARSSKREAKTLMASISSKSLEAHPTQSAQAAQAALVAGDAAARRGRGRYELGPESPDAELELPTGLVSSDDTPSPTQDIFAETNMQKSSPEGVLSQADIILPKSTEPIAESPKKAAISAKQKYPEAARKKHSKSVADAEVGARGIADRISQQIDNSDRLAPENHLAVANSKDRLNSLYAELRSNVSKIEERIKSRKEERRKEVEAREEDPESTFSSRYRRKGVTKRKLNEDSEREKMQDEENEEPPLSQQQKFLSMTKAWNDIKERVQEERIKAEQKMKELGVMGRDEEDGDETGSERWEQEAVTEERGQEASEGAPVVGADTGKKAEAGFAGFGNVEFMRSELEKTDKAFKRLKNEKVRGGKEKTKGKGSGQENASFRTESRTAPKCVDEFQSEYQKQNLLKALKAIDVGKDGSSGSEGTGESPRTEEVAGTRTPTPFTSAKDAREARGARDPKSDLINELFGSRPKKLDRSDGVGLEYRMIDGIKARNN